MPTYSFPDFSVQIKDPTITLDSYTDHMNNTCTVNIRLALGSDPMATKFMVTLVGYTYLTEPTHADINAWILVELVNYEV